MVDKKRRGRPPKTEREREREIIREARSTPITYISAKDYMHMNTDELKIRRKFAVRKHNSEKDPKKRQEYRTNIKTIGKVLADRMSRIGDTKDIKKRLDEIWEEMSRLKSVGDFILDDDTVISWDDEGVKERGRRLKELEKERVKLKANLDSIEY